MIPRLLIVLFTAIVTNANAQTVVPPLLKDMFPQLKVTPKVPTKREEQRGKEYIETMTISPQVIVESSGAAKIAPATATMLIITMDTKAKYVDHREVFKVHSTESISIPGADRGGRREFEFKPIKVSYDEYRDATNTGGHIYKWYIFGLRDQETKQILHFETNNTPLAKFIATHPDQRDKYLSLKAGVPFTENFK
jgi:hypothetical protein